MFDMEFLYFIFLYILSEVSMSPVARLNALCLVSMLHRGIDSWLKGLMDYLLLSCNLLK